MDENQNTSTIPAEKQPITSIPLTEAEKKAKWLADAIQEGLDRSRKKKENFKIKASLIKIGTVILSGTVTVLLGLQIKGFEDTSKMLAFILGAVVTILNALEPFFNFRSLWIEHEEAVYRLYRLQDDLTFYLIGRQPEEVSLEKLEEFNKRYGQIWVDVSRHWLEIRRMDGKKEK